MKCKISILTTLLIIFSVMNCNQALAQNNENKSNGTLEMLALYVPDFIAFKPAEGQTIETYSVFLVSGTKSYQALKTKSLYLDIKMVDGKLQSTCTDKSEIRAMNFDIPNSEINFKPEKIKFVIDNIEMYYDLTKSEWEEDEKQ